MHKKNFHFNRKKLSGGELTAVYLQEKPIIQPIKVRSDIVERIIQEKTITEGGDEQQQIRTFSTVIFFNNSI